MSFHRDRDALAEYQASKEHGEVTGRYVWGFADDVTRFDFEVGQGEGGDWVMEFVSGALGS